MHAASSTNVASFMAEANNDAEWRQLGWSSEEYRVMYFNAFLLVGVQ